MMGLSVNLRSEYSESSIGFRTKHGVERERLDKSVMVAIYPLELPGIRNHQTSSPDCYSLEVGEKRRSKTEKSQMPVMRNAA